MRSQLGSGPWLPAEQRKNLIVGIKIIDSHGNKTEMDQTSVQSSSFFASLASIGHFFFFFWTSVYCYVATDIASPKAGARRRPVRGKMLLRTPYLHRGCGAPFATWCPRSNIGHFSQKRRHQQESKLNPAFWTDSVHEH